MNVLKTYARYISGLVLSVCFLFNIFGKSGGFVTERRIFCELCFISRYKFIAILNVMDVADCEASSLFEEGAENLAVYFLAGVLLVIGLEDFSFKGVMTAKS